MQEVLNHLAALILFAPLACLLLAPVALMFCATILGLEEALDDAQEFSERWQAGWKEFQEGVRKGMADYESRHPR